MPAHIEFHRFCIAFVVFWPLKGTGSVTKREGIWAYADTPYPPSARHSRTLAWLWHTCTDWRLIALQQTWILQYHSFVRDRDKPWSLLQLILICIFFFLVSHSLFLFFFFWLNGFRYSIRPLSVRVTQFKQYVSKSKDNNNKKKRLIESSEGN